MPLHPSTEDVTEMTVHKHMANENSTYEHGHSLQRSTVDRERLFKHPPETIRPHFLRGNVVVLVQNLARDEKKLH